MDEIRAMMESHFFGTLAVTRAFASALMSNAPGAVLNVVSGGVLDPSTDARRLCRGEDRPVGTIRRAT